MGFVTGGNSGSFELRNQIEEMTKMYSKRITADDLAEFGQSIGAGSLFVRNGNIVSMCIDDGKTKEEYTTRWNSFLHIPAGYRPISRVSSVGYDLYRGLTVAINIQGDNMSFVKNGMNTGSGVLSVYCYVTWITNDDFPE